MAYEKILYDITALEMFKRLEALTKLPNNMSAFQSVIQKAGCGDIYKYVRETRANRIAHFEKSDKSTEFSPMPYGALSFDEFKEFQEKCFQLDDVVSSNLDKFCTEFHMRMREIMIPTLKYDMGNGADIVKHGLLAEFVEWWSESGRDCLQVADTFAGCPWGDLSSARGRLKKLKDTALGRVYANGNGADKYFGSSHLVREVAQRRQLKVAIDVSDNDENARHNLEISMADSMKMIELPDKNDGYKILSADNWKQPEYDLIFIDPYSDFFPNAPRGVHAPPHGCVFSDIKNLVDGKNQLFIALVLFGEVEKAKLKGHAVSLHCPIIGENGKAKKGEAKLDAEILLIGKEIADSNCEGLRDKLEKFASAATAALKRDLPKGEQVVFNKY